MPQFDFNIIPSLTIFYVSFAILILMCVFFFTALSMWLDAQVRLAFITYIANEHKLLVLNPASIKLFNNNNVLFSIFFSFDLLEQFLLGGAYSKIAALFVFASLVVLIIFFNITSIFYSLIAFVGEVGKDINQNYSIYFGRMWINLSVVFICVLIGNLLGVVPFAFTFTSSLAVPFLFSLLIFFVCFYIIVTSGGLKGLAGLLPAGTSASIAPLIVLIEFVSNFAKFISLGVRLFANMFAGHLLLKVFYSICYQLALQASVFAILTNSLIFLFVIFITSLELMIALLQAFVMLLLSILYIKEAVNFISGSH